MSDLPTIVIPYYKLPYLDTALASLAAQTRQGFQVFIGDDASPENPEAVLRKYQGRLDIRYHRYNENLGRASLVSNWNRCVRETNSEWVWLFSDDDIAGPDCMESFLTTRQETGERFDVYRFNTKVIDGNGTVTHEPQKHPQSESGPDFAMAKITENRWSLAVEYIFRRSAFEAAGGFVDFPLGWHSDDASWVAFARRTGFRTMEKGEVRWRQSGLNLSTPKPEYVDAKLAAFRGYLKWLKKEVPDAVFQQKLRYEVRRWFPRQFGYWGGRPGVVAGVKFWIFFSVFTGASNFYLLRKFLGLTGFRSYLGMRKASPSTSRS